MGHKANRDYSINQRLQDFVYQNMLKPSKIADVCGIRRDTFSAILGSRRPIYAEEILPICNVCKIPVRYLLEGEQGDKRA